MDIQFVLDVYACATYIVSYISKAQKEMNELLRQACDETRKGNSSIKQHVRDIGNKFLNSVEISRQEGVYIVLQLPMKKSSSQVIFINTTLCDERVQLLKPINDIQEMEDDCEDVFSYGLLKIYAKRPLSLGHLTLADWAAWYDSGGKPYIKKSFPNDTDNLPLVTVDSDENGDDLFDDNTINSKNTEKRDQKSELSEVFGIIVKKIQKKHYQEPNMLFTLWRNEYTDLLTNFFFLPRTFLSVKDRLDEQMKLYAVCSENLDKIHEHFIALDEDNDHFGLIAPSTQNIEYQD